MNLTMHSKLLHHNSCHLQGHSSHFDPYMLYNDRITSSVCEGKTHPYNQMSVMTLHGST